MSLKAGRSLQGLKNGLISMPCYFEIERNLWQHKYQGPIWISLTGQKPWDSWWTWKWSEFPKFINPNQNLWWFFYEIPKIKLKKSTKELDSEALIIEKRKIELFEEHIRKKNNKYQDDEDYSFLTSLILTIKQLNRKNKVKNENFRQCYVGFRSPQFYWSSENRSIIHLWSGEWCHIKHNNRW